ncbi:hypothetical protein Tco_1359566 [Tanacetum coccineum]
MPALLMPFYTDCFNNVILIQAKTYQGFSCSRHGTELERITVCGLCFFGRRGLRRLFCTDTRGQRIGSTGSGSRRGKRRAADSLSGRHMVPQSRDRNARIHDLMYSKEGMTTKTYIMLGLGETDKTTKKKQADLILKRESGIRATSFERMYIVRLEIAGI